MADFEKCKDEGALSCPGRFSQTSYPVGHLGSHLFGRPCRNTAIFERYNIPSPIVDPLGHLEMKTQRVTFKKSGHLFFE